MTACVLIIKKERKSHLHSGVSAVIGDNFAVWSQQLRQVHPLRDWTGWTRAEQTEPGNGNTNSVARTSRNLRSVAATVGEIIVFVFDVFTSAWVDRIVLNSAAPRSRELCRLAGTGYYIILDAMSENQMTATGPNFFISISRSVGRIGCHANATHNSFVQILACRRCRIFGISLHAFFHHRLLLFLRITTICVCFIRLCSLYID